MKLILKTPSQKPISGNLFISDFGELLMVKLLFCLFFCLFFTLEISYAVSGTSPNNAIPAVADTNETNYQGLDVWFVYTATKTGKITVYNCNMTTFNTVVMIYKKQGYSQTLIEANDNGCGEQSKVSFASDSGAIYYIVWRIWYATGTFKWILKEQNPKPGDICSLALDASIGDNVADNSNGSQWFKYVATGFNKIIISTCGLTTEITSVSIYKGTCDNLKPALYTIKNCDNQVEVTFASEENETYYIKWDNNYTSSSFHWTLNLENYIPGEICKTAITAEVGENIADNSKGEQWFLYKANHTGKTVISTCGLTTENTTIDVYTGKCDFFTSVAFNDNFCDNQTEVRFDAQEGQEYFIVWRNMFTSASYPWIIKEMDWEQGETCENGIPAKVDTNVVELDNYLYKFFEFKSPRTSKVTISTCGFTTAETNVGVFKKNCNNIVETENEPCGLQTRASFEADSDQVYQIYISASSPETFNFVITLDSLPAGKYCGSSLIAKIGSNTTMNGDTWYKYTATKKQKVTVSSCGLTDKHTYVYLYKGRCSDLLYINSAENTCDFQSSLTFFVDSGENYYLVWGSYTNDVFSWTLTEEPVLPGEFCEVAIPARIGTNIADNSNGSQWFVFTAPKDAKMLISTCKLTSENTCVNIYTGNCDELYYFAFNNDACETQSEVVFNAEAGTTYYIQWQNTFTNGQYPWVLLEDSVAPSEILQINGRNSLCMGEQNVEYSINTYNAEYFLWFLPDGSKDSTTTPNIVIPEATTDLNGVLKVFAVNKYGNSDTAQLNLVVNPVPLQPIITRNGNTLSSNYTSGNQWYNLEGIIAGAVNQSYSANKTGKYFVVVTLNGCSSIPSDTVELTISSINLPSSNEFVFYTYPNPVKDFLLIELKNSTAQASYELVNLLGVTITKGTFFEKTIIDTRNWKSGVYILKLSDETGAFKITRIQK